MEALKSLFSKILGLLKPVWNMYKKQTNTVKTITCISCGIGFLCIKKLYKNYNYNKKEFKLTPTNVSSKVILITGCGSGIGQALTYKLNKIGFVVIATCRRKESVDKYLSDNEFIKNGSISYQLDVTQNKHILSVKKEIKSFLKKNNYTLWGLVNNAAIIYYGPFEFQTYETIQKQIDVNFSAPANISHQFIPLLYGRCNKINGNKLANGGRIVNISSISAYIPFQSFCVYNATKAALSHFSNGLRVELSPRFGIWCSAIELGPFKTNMSATNKSADDKYNQLVKIFENRDDVTNYNMDQENDIYQKVKKMSSDSINEDLTIVVDDIIHSLTAKYPKRAYYPGVTTAFHIIVDLIKKYQRFERMVICGDVQNLYAN